MSQYLLGVIAYYRQNYEHAIQHLLEAKIKHGFDYAIGSMLGHCMIMLHEPEKAETIYKKVLQSYNRPEDMHMLYVRYAAISELFGQSQKARKLMLLACKHSPTPYTWLGVGILYMQQNDLLSAEECLIQANICDPNLAETWAYLALLNLRLNKLNEAELSCKQAFRVSCTERN